MEVEGVLAARERSLVETLIVINATGVIIHTNLGRAPWPLEVAAAAADAANNYLLLELDRESWPAWGALPCRRGRTWSS
jgi:L-seryl-tRNA(Ser) seleniumtransferase